MAEAKNIQNQLKYGGRGYLDYKLEPVANLTALNEKFDIFTEISTGMTVTVINDGTDGFPHDYIYINNAWSRKDADIQAKLDLKAYSSAVTAEIASALTQYRTASEQDTIDSGKADKATTLSGYGITDAVKTVNGVVPVNGNVNTRAFSDVIGIDSFKTNHTTSEFCVKFLEVMNPSIGSAYLTGGICFTDMPKSFFENSLDQGDYATCELIIYVPSAGCLLLEIDTTNNYTQKWRGGAGIFRAIYDVSTRQLLLPWSGSLTCPQTTEMIGEGSSKEFKFIATKDSDAVSKYYLDTELKDKQDKLISTGSSQNIKTINGQDILGSGNIEISGGSSIEYTAGDNIKIEDHKISVTGMTEAIASATTDMATKTWIEGKGYLTEHQDISGKVNRMLEGTNGKSYIFNETDGGGAKFEHNDGTISFVGVNDGGKDSNLSAQIYSVNKNTNVGTRINVTEDGIYYTNGHSTYDFNVNDEIAVKKNINEATQDMATKTWVEGKGYLTQHQSLKTINNQSIVGSGNIEISGSGTGSLTSNLTVQVAVGNLAVGRVFSAGTSIESILREMVTTSYENVTLSLGVSGSGSSSSDILGTLITLNKGGQQIQYTWAGTNIEFQVANGVSYSLIFSYVSGYSTPDSVTYTAIGNNSRTINIIYPKGEDHLKFYKQVISNNAEKIENYVNNGYLVADYPFSTNYNSNLILSDFVESANFIDTNPWNLGYSNITQLVSLVIPSSYTIDYVYDIINDPKKENNIKDTFYNIKQENINIGNNIYTAYTFFWMGGIEATTQEIKFKK